MRKLLARVVYCALPLVASTASAAIYTNGVANYGKLNQRTLPQPIGDVACAPVSVANSFVYLERKFPAYYNRKLIPDLNNDNIIDPVEISAVALRLSGVQYMNTQLPAGGGGNPPPPPQYYDPNQSGHVPPAPPGTAPGGTYHEYIAWGKEAYLKDPANMIPPTLLAGQMTNPWAAPFPKPGWMEDNALITAGAIAARVNDGWDVEIAFQWQKLMGNQWADLPGGHCVTVYGFEYVDQNNDGKWQPAEVVTHLKFIDPWNDLPIGPPAVENAPDITGTLNVIGADLILDYNGGAVGPLIAGTVRGKINFWIAEVPEPATLALLVLVLPLMRRR